MADGYARAGGQSGRRLRHHRPRPHQRHHRHGPGARRFGAHAGDLRRQPARLARQGPRLPARVAGPARPDAESGAVLGAHRGAGGASRRPGARLRPDGLRPRPARSISRCRSTSWRFPPSRRPPPSSRPRQPRRAPRRRRWRRPPPSRQGRPGRSSWPAVAPVGQRRRSSRLAERLGAPVVTTANGRGLLYGHPLMRAGQSEPDSRARR